MRVHELAKDLGLSSKELIDLLARLKVSVKSHSSSLDESTVRRAREQVAARGGKAAAPAAPAAPPRADVKTPTGERIISIRKIAAPPVRGAPAPPKPPAKTGGGAPADPHRAGEAPVPRGGAGGHPRGRAAGRDLPDLRTHGSPGPPAGFCAAPRPP